MENQVLVIRKAKEMENNMPTIWTAVISGSYALAVSQDDVKECFRGQPRGSDLPVVDVQKELNAMCNKYGKPVEVTTSEDVAFVFTAYRFMK